MENEKEYDFADLWAVKENPPEVEEKINEEWEVNPLF